MSTAPVAVLATTTLEFVPCTPRNLTMVLSVQLERYMAIQAYDALETGEAEYRRTLQDTIEAFTWNEEQAEAGLLDVAVFDPRLTGEYLANIGGVTCYINPPDECTNYEAVLTPEGIYVAQLQLGPMHKGIAPRDFRSTHSPLEQGLTVKEGLSVLALRGHDFLSVCYANLPGSSSSDGRVPYLGLDGAGPCLDSHYGDGASSGYGSASRGS